MAYHRCGAPSSGGGGASTTLMQTMDEITETVGGVNVQNKTVTFNCNVGDLIIRAPAGGSGSWTGAQLLYTNTSPAAGSVSIYKATSSTVTITGSGNSSSVIVFKNSKRLTDAITGYATQNITTNATLPNAKAGDLVILYGYSPLNLTTYTDVLNIGVLTSAVWIFKCLSSNATMYRAGTNYPAIIVHLS